MKPTLSLTPTKRLFVEMLTRDIELEDAILDLLDNSVDGAMRSHGYDPQADRPYAGFSASLHFSTERFVIADNCGGIPKELRDSAFRLGRLDDNIARSLPTIGSVGIGMKRAIFKLGRNCVIASKTSEDGFRVEIKPEWFKSLTWEVEVEETPGQQGGGTTITATELLPDVAAAFAGPTGFADRFRSRVSQYYSILIDKGFAVIINQKPVVPMPITFKVGELASAAKGEAIAPYIYEGQIGGVNVEVVVGFYSPFQLDPDEEPIKGKAEEAGWTVVCNDRVVLYKDKTILTGWGDGAPSYHPQFRQIAGVAVFSSENPELLPLTTTKKGIDAQSKIFLETRKRMRDGLAKFTNYTNRLKRLREPDLAQIFHGTSNVDLRALRAEKQSLHIEGAKTAGGQGRVFDFPLPAVGESTEKKMVFTRPLDRVRKVAKYLFEDPDHAPSEVAAEAFDQTYKRARGQK